MNLLVLLASLLGLCIVFGIPVFLLSSFGVAERGEQENRNPKSRLSIAQCATRTLRGSSRPTQCRKATTPARAANRKPLAKTPK